MGVVTKPNYICTCGCLESEHVRDAMSNPPDAKRCTVCPCNEFNWVGDEPDMSVEDRKLIDRIDAFGKGLTHFEIKFVESCSKRLDRGETLTEKQRKVAEDIDERRVS